MRLTILANADIESNIAVNLLLQAFPGYISHIFLSEPAKPVKNTSPTALQELHYIEKTFFRDIFFPLLEQHPIRQKKFLSFHQISNQFLIPVTQLNGITEFQDQQKLVSAKPDLILSIRYNRILNSEAITIPRLGVINLHLGQLPNYRGVLCCFRALLNGDSEMGATLHFINDPAINQGDIIARRHIKVNDDKSLFWHIIQLYFSAIPMMIETVEKIAHGTKLSKIPQNPQEGKYYSFPTAQEFHDFHAKGWRLSDPTDIEMVTGYYH